MRLALAALLRFRLPGCGRRRWLRDSIPERRSWRLQSITSQRSVAEDRRGVQYLKERFGDARRSMSHAMLAASFIVADTAKPEIVEFFRDVVDGVIAEEDKAAQSPAGEGFEILWRQSVDSPRFGNPVTVTLPPAERSTRRTCISAPGNGGTWSGSHATRRSALRIPVCQ